MAERTSSTSLFRERIARTPLRNKREIDRASLTSVSRTIAASDVSSRSKSVDRIGVDDNYIQFGATGK